jgi:phosphate transport system permease protein
MSPALPLLLALALGLIAWLVARSRAWALRKEALAHGGALHSLPHYHGWYVALWAAVPAVLFALVWSSLSPGLVLGQVMADPAAASLPAFGIQRDSVLAEAQAVASGAAVSAFLPESAKLVEPFRAAMLQYGTIGIVVTLLLGFAGGAFGFLRLRPDFTARTRVERSC